MVEWVELSENKRKALRILLKESKENIQTISKYTGISRGSIFNKLKGSSRFKKTEYEKILETLNITECEVEKCSESHILKFVS